MPTTEHYIAAQALAREGGTRWSMSSSEFANIFDHAAGIVRIRCHGLSGLESVIASLRERALSVHTDPRLHRELFFEPWLDSQQLSVPQDTAEEVARQFHQLSVLKLWTRVKCPDVPVEEDGTIIETASDIEFKEALDRPCPDCGSLHELVPAIVETLYAPNFPGQAKPQPFDAHRLRDEIKLDDCVHRDEQIVQALEAWADNRVVRVVRGEWRDGNVRR